MRCTMKGIHRILSAVLCIGVMLGLMIPISAPLPASAQTHTPPPAPTTVTFYPDADPETSSVDGTTFRWDVTDTSWAALALYETRPTRGDALLDKGVPGDGIIKAPGLKK